MSFNFSYNIFAKLDSLRNYNNNNNGHTAPEKQQKNSLENHLHKLDNGLSQQTTGRSDPEVNMRLENLAVCQTCRVR